MIQNVTIFLVDDLLELWLASEYREVIREVKKRALKQVKKGRVQSVRMIIGHRLQKRVLHNSSSPVVWDVYFAEEVGVRHKNQKYVNGFLIRVVSGRKGGRMKKADKVLLMKFLKRSAAAKKGWKKRKAAQKKTKGKRGKSKTKNSRNRL